MRSLPFIKSRNYKSQDTDIQYQGKFFPIRARTHFLLMDLRSEPKKKSISAKRTTVLILTISLHLNSTCSLQISKTDRPVHLQDHLQLHQLPPSQPLEKFNCNSCRSTHRGQLFHNFVFIVRSWTRINQQHYYIL